MPRTGTVVVTAESRLAFTDDELYANGRRYARCDNDQWLIELIDRRRIDIKTVKAAGKPAMQLLQQLFDHGVLDSDE